MNKPINHTRFFFRITRFGAALLMTALLCACTEQDVHVDINDDSGYSLPVVSGLSHSDEINAALASKLSPYAQQAQQTVEASEGRLQVEYDIAKAEDYGFFHPSYTMEMRISDGQDALTILRATGSKPADLRVEPVEDLQWLDSADLTECALILKRTGLEVDLSDPDAFIGEEFATDTFVRLYEAIAEKPLDISDVAVGASKGETFQKALKLGMLSAYGYYDNYEYMPQVNLYSVLTMADAVMDRAEFEVYGRQSQAVTGEEFASMIRTMHGVCRAPELEDAADDKLSWAALGEVDLDALAAKGAGGQQMECNRLDAAEILCRIADAGPAYDRSFSDSHLILIDDTDNIWARRAITYNFMEYYGDSVLFAPYADFTVTNAIRNARSFITSRYDDWSYATNYEWNGFYTKKDLLIAAGRTAAYFDSRSAEDKYVKYGFEKKNVLNDRDYNWFFSQRGTGSYASINCMPSITAMAAHWYDQNSTATVESMRAASKSKLGWDMETLRQTLRACHIPFETGYADLPTILKALDEGKIILVQYSDRPLNQTGHCYVIYGYHRHGDAITFIINDSESMSFRGEIFGRENGNGDEVDASFALWSIQRFYSGITLIG